MARTAVRLRRASFLVVVALATVGCENVLDVQLPNVIPPDRLEGEAGAAALYHGALGQFAESWSGGGSLPGRVLISGLLSDEYQSTANLTQFQDLDRRDARSDQFLVGLGYELLHRARHGLEDGARRMHDMILRPEDDPRIGKMWALSGFVHVALAEDYCDGITISHFPDSGAPVFGDPLTRAEVLRLSLGRFDSAATWSAGDADVESLARLGKARALLNLGDFEAASASATAVLDGFAYANEHGDATRNLWNSVYYLGQVFRRWSVAEGEGGNGLPYRTALDPRVPVEAEPSPGNEATVDSYAYLGYSARADPFLMADDVDARLIE
ncbi:MAG: hypothetical protein OEO23_14825, partial [Gemmatimonadota bacterium]|nr:hypothetical protein [Gemmatimonadota bacterium]